MTENKYWFIVLILETILTLMLIDLSVVLLMHGHNIIAWCIKIIIGLYLFYKLGKYINELFNKTRL